MDEKIKVRRATIHDVSAMQELVRKAYIQKGYLSPTGDTVTYPDLNSNNHVAFVATIFNPVNNSDTVVGTVTVSFGVPKDLTLTEEFPKEIEAVWKETYYGQLAYVSRLTVEKKWRKSKVTPMLFRAVAKLCVEKVGEAVLCIINPKHVNFYTDWGFEELVRKEKIKGLEEKVPAVLMVFYQFYKTLPQEYEKLMLKDLVRRQNKRPKPIGLPEPQYV